MTLKPVLIEPPPVLPVSLEEARNHCRIDSTEEDGLLETLIAAATTYCDGYSGILHRALIEQTWEQSVNAFPVYPCTGIELSLIPVQSIAEVAYYDLDNQPAVMDPADYALFTNQTGAYLTLAPGGSWPPAYGRTDSVRIQYVAGYGPAPRNVPAAIRQAILLMVGAWYDDRMTTQIPPAADRLLSAYRPVIF